MGLLENFSPDFLATMPTVLRVGPYRFHFYSGENSEPPHVHVARDNFEAKFWLRPVSIADNHGFRAAELMRSHRHVEHHCEFLLTANRDFHGK